MKTVRCLLTVFSVFFLMIFISCGENDKPPTPAAKSGPAAPKSSLRIVSGSENKGLEPLIKAFAQKEGVKIEMDYQGSIDMTLLLAEQGAKIGYDAVWPANSLWLSLADQQKAVRHTESIMRSPVILGVKKSLAERLGWIGKTDIRISDILEKARGGMLRFAMTSATQSNSGASAYFGFLYALSGSTDMLLESDLEKTEVREKVKELLSRVDRSSGSSGWLKDTLVNHYIRFQAMFNYESMIIEANRELTAAGKEPLYAVYPVDGVMIADSPLGYVDKGNPAKEALFKKLQEYLLSAAVEADIMKQGWRTGLIGLNPDSADKNIFNPDWGIDVARIISPVPTPSEPVIRKALDLYQVALRKPSCTAYVVDVSGSMEGKGIADLKNAMTTLLDPDQARRYMLQASADDIHIILPFNNKTLQGMKAQGNSPEVLGQLLAFVQGLSAGGGTDIYNAAAGGLELISRVENIEDYFPAVILMTDGRSAGDIGILKSKMAQLPMASDIPVFSITFGDADEKQLQEISEMTIGSVFPGDNLVSAFRKAKGYN